MCQTTCEMGAVTVCAKWRNVRGYEDLYIVSDDGEVMGMERGKKLAQTTNFNGDPCVTLARAGRHSAIAVKRLVADAFVDDGPGRYLRHIDGDRTNNRADNLVWSISPHTPSKRELEDWIARGTCTVGRIARRYGAKEDTVQRWLRRYHLSVSDRYATCPSCGRTFVQRRAGQVYCSRACEMRADIARMREG